VTNIQDLRMNCKSNVKINFDGGDLSSDSGLLLYKDFIKALGVKETLVEHIPSLNDDKNHRDHENIDVFLQKTYQKIAGYHTDSSANNLREDPVFQEITEKEYLASQATLSRYNNSLTKDSMKEFQQANLTVLDNVYQIQTPNLFMTWIPFMLIHVVNNMARLIIAIMVGQVFTLWLCLMVIMGIFLKPY